MCDRIDIKIVLLGCENIGKTAMIIRYIHDRFHENHNMSTIGGAFLSKQVVANGTTVMLGIWDTAGSERYKSMVKMFYRNAKAAVICYDICNQNSWDQLRWWITEIRNNEEDCELYLCGTKKDLVEDGLADRCISWGKANAYAKSIGAQHIETSSKTGENIDLLFQMIAEDLVRKGLTPTPSWGERLNHETVTSRRCCF